MIGDPSGKSQERNLLDEANQAFWRAEAVRYQKASVSGAVSKEKVDEALTQRSKAVATVAKGKADLENMLLDLSFTNISAPFAGRVQETRINIGNLVEQQKDVLTTLVQMDRIVVLDAGRIVEEGTHRELLRAGGLYARYWERQSGGFLNYREAAE